jgi:large repetitive protein
VYVADTYNSAVKKVPYSGGSYGTPVTLGSGFSYPFSVAVDGAGNVYVTDTSNNAVKKVPYSGGSYGTPVTLGSGFSIPFGVAVDGAGNVYVADYNNNAVKEIDLSDPPSLTFANTAVGSTSASQTETIANDGNAPLLFPVPSMGGNPSLSANFSLSGSSTCPQLTASSSMPGSLAAGAACTGILSFVPTTTGSISGQLVLTDNNLNATVSPGTMQTISLSGTGTTPPAPAVTGISPTYGPAVGGTSVTITGTYLTGASAVNFGATPATGFTVSSDTSITATSPAGVTGTVDVTVTTPGGTSATGTVDQFSYQQTQTITFPQPVTPAAALSSVTLTATASSGLPVTYTVVIGPATISGSTLTYIGPGTVVVEADQAGNTTYSAAVPVQHTILVTATSNVGTPSNTLTALVTITTAGTASAINALTQGAANLDFNVVSGGTCATSGSASTYAVGAICTVAYVFTPSHPGTHLGGITLTDSSGVVLGTAYVSGTGVGPQITYPPGTRTTLASGFQELAGMSVDESGNLFVADTINNAIEELLYSGGHYGTPVILGSGFNLPRGTAVDGSGNVFVADVGSNSIKEIPYSAGSYGTPVILGSGFSSPSGVAADGSGNVFVADMGNRMVKEIPYSGGSYGTPVILASGFRNPFSVAVDGSGNVFVSDPTARAVKEIPYSGGSYGAPVAIGSGVGFPVGLTVDANGNVFAADGDSNTVTEIPYRGGRYGAAVTVASGFDQPEGLAMDGSGNIFVADSDPNNSRVEKLDLADSPALTFASTNDGLTSSDSPQMITIQNDGNAALMFATPGTGTNPAISTGFAIDGSSTCPQLTAGTLDPSTVCTEVVNFAPSGQSGSVSGSLVNTDNDLNATDATQTILLAGTAVQLTPTVSVANFTMPYGFSSATLSATVTFTSGMTPTGAFSFTVDSGPSITATCSGSTSTTETCVANYPTSSFASATSGSATYTITGTLAADGNYAAASNTGTLTVTQGTPVMAVSSSSISYGTASTTLMATVIYNGSAAPSGVVSFTVNGSATGVGTVICTGSASPLSCTATYNTSTLAAGSYVIVATEAADSNYVSASNTAGATLIVTQITPTVTVSSPATNYGAASTTLSATVAYSGSRAPMGAVSFTVNSGTAQQATCTGSSSPLTCTASYNSSTLAAGGYGIAVSVAADTNYNTASGSGTLTVNKVTPGFGTMRFSPSATESYGTSQIIVVSDTLAYTGAAAPGGAVTYILNGVSYSASCTGSATPLTCTASVPAATIAALSTNGYTVTASYATDANYIAATGASGTFTISKATPSFGMMNFSPSGTEPYGTNQAITISDTLTYTGATAPVGAVTYILNGVSYTASCSGTTTPLICTASVPAASIAALPATGYTVTADYAADTNYTAATGTSGTFTINKAMPSFGAMSFSPSATESYGTSQAITISDTLAFAGITPPSGAVTFTLNGASYTASCSGTATPLACSATVPAAAIAALPAAAYTVAVAYATDTNYAAATGTGATFTINQASQTITFGMLASVTYGVSPITLAATGGASNNPVTLSITSGGAFGSLSGTNNSILTITGAGSITVTASQAGNANYAAATNVAQTLVINKAAPTFGAMSFSPAASEAYGTSQVVTISDTLAYTGSTAPSGAVTYALNGVSYTASCSGTNTPLTCTANVPAVAIAALPAAGYTVTVAYTADGNYAGSVGTSGIFTINKTAQTLAGFTALPASPETYGVGPITLSATGGASGNAVTFSLDSSSTGTGSISGTTLTVTGAGSLVIDVNQAGNANYTAAPQIQQTIVVNKASQTINFTAPATPVTFGVSPITLSATGGSSGITVTFTIDASSTGTGSISGNILTVTGAGTFTIDANQNGNTSYSGATQVQRTMVVNQAAQTINFTAPTTPVIYGVSPIALSAAGGSSGNTVIFTIDASSTGTGNISGTMLTVNGVGTIVIDANQAGNANYSAATQVQRAVVVNQAAQSITFTAPTTPVIYGVSPITLSAIGGGSGNAVIFRITSGATLGSLSGTNNHTLTITGAGSITIAASQAGNANYSAAADVSQTIVINQATPTFGAMSFSPAAAETYGTSQIITISDTLAYAGGTAPSGAVTYTLNGVGYASTCPGSSTPLICTANVPAVVIAALPATGYTVTAAYMADGNYTTTAGASGVFTINKTAQILTGFTASPASPEIYGVGAITLSATGGASGNPVTFSLDSSSTGTGNISGTTLTVTGVGSLIVDVNQTGNPNYTAATQIQRTIVVNKATPAFGTMSFSPAAAEPFGTSQIVTINDTLAYTGSTAPSGTVTYTLNGVSYTASCSGTGTPLTCTANIPAAVVAALSSTGYIATAAYTADINYAATIGTNGTFTITQALQTINFIGPLTPVVYGVAPITLSATGGSSGNAVIFTIDASSTGSGSISGTTLTVTGAGTIVIDANQAGNANYSAATPVQRTIVVGRAAPAVTFTVPSHTYGDASFTVSASSNSTGAFTYSVVSGPTTISGSTVTLNGAGTVVLQASEAADANYIAATKDATFAVSGATPVITFLVPDHTYGDPPFTVSASSDSTGTFTYSVVSGLATISGSTVTLNGAGTVVLQASEAADANYTAATKNATFAVSAAAPVIAFTVPNHTYGDAPFTMSATSNSTGSFTYAVVSGPATISGSTVTVTGVGTVTLQASEAANANYTASTKDVAFTISAATPVITFTVPNHTYGDAPFTVFASSNSSGAFTYSVVSGLATISGSTVTLTGAGTVAVRASEAADANYTVATKDATFVASAATPVITFTVPNHTYGDAPFTVSASSNSSGAFIYTVVSGPVMISGSTVTPTGVGAVVLQASEIADTNYAAGVTNATFNIFAATLTATANNATRYYGAANPGFTGSTTGAMYSDTFTESFTTTATTLSPPASYTIAPTVAGPHIGDYTVTAINGVLTVTQAPTTASVKVSNITLNPNQTVTLTAQVTSTTSGTPTGAVTFNDNGSPIQTVMLTSGGASYTTVLSPGLAHAITVNYSGDTNFLSSTSTAPGVTVTVAPLEFTVSTIAGSNAQTVAPGMAATYTFSISPNYTSYPGPVSFTVTGLPPGATATFSPSMIPANGGKQSVTMTIQTRAPFAHNAGGALGRGIPTMLALLLLPFAGSRKLRRKIGTRLMMLALLLAGGVAITGCGTGNGFLLEQPQTYTLNMTATSAGLQQTQTFTLIVQ